MILADKIIRLRKKKGWSQEELASVMNISRQAVSKWESAQTVPDIEKILQLSEIFGVTTDYLLKDDIEDEEFIIDSDKEPCAKRITVKEANTFLEQRKRASWQIAVATLLCILSPIALLVLGAASEDPRLGVPEVAAGVIGLGALFAFVLCAVPMFIYCGFKNEPFAFLDDNIPFELEYGAEEAVREYQRNFRSAYIKWNIIAACICVFSPVPLILSAFGGNDMLCVLMLCVTMVLAGIGAAIFIVVGVRNASAQKLLCEGEYRKEEKKRSGIKDALSSAYWGVITVAYLLWSFLSNDWHITWIIFALGGVLFPLVVSFCEFIESKSKKD